MTTTTAPATSSVESFFAGFLSGIARLEFKWTVSRGRETYGYNICSLWIDGQKVSTCKGGGYDMEGTALAEWLQKTFQSDLQALFSEQLTKGEERHPNGFYGVRLDLEEKIVRLNGAAGFRSMGYVAKALGIDLEYSFNSSNKNKTVYFASLLKNEALNKTIASVA